MMTWLWELFDDPKVAEAKVLKQLLRDAPELPEWSVAVQPVLTRLLTSNQIQQPMFSRQSHRCGDFESGESGGQAGGDDPRLGRAGRRSPGQIRGPVGFQGL